MKLRIFLVDDERDLAMSIKLGLERNGFLVDVFCDPQEALKNYDCGAYDLLMIDLRMPKMNGLELASAIRFRDQNTPIWFMTAFEIYPEEFRNVYSSIQDSMLVRKPISLHELTSKLTCELVLRNASIIT